MRSFKLSIWDESLGVDEPASHELEFKETLHGDLVLQIRPVDGDKRRKRYGCKAGPGLAKKLASFLYGLAKRSGVE